jgi:hypothetical protein
MILPLGGGLLLVGGFAMLMMNVTGTIPRRLPSRRGNRREDDPEGWKRWLIAYGAMAVVGALLILIGLVAGR